MRKLIAFIGLLLIANLCLANRVKTTDYFHIAGAVIDTAAAGTDIAPDSVRILVYFEGAEVFDAWFNTGDAQCFAGEGSDIVFTDQYADIDNDEGSGTYYIRSLFYAKDEVLYHKASDYFELGLFGDTAQVNVAEAGDAMTLTATAYGIIQDTMALSASTYQSDGDTNQVNVSTFDNTTDKVLLQDSTALDISNIWNNPNNFKSDGDTNQVNVAVAGGAMTLTAAAYGVIQDTMALSASVYKSDGDTNQVDLTNYDGATPLTASDNIGINWGDVSNPTTALNLSATNIDVDQVVASISGNVDGSVASVTGKVTLVDSSAGDISYTANNQGDYHSDGDTNQVNVSTLTEESNIGIDLDDVTGTLSDAEIETISTNAVQISGSPDAADSLEKTVLGTLADYSDYQGAGADATPSEWDATDSTVFLGIIFEASDTADYNDVAGTGCRSGCNALRMGGR